LHPTYAAHFTSLAPTDLSTLDACRAIRNYSAHRSCARPRVGQGAFRARLVSAYGARCAITGERTEPVLDAAHVQPYLGPRSNHIQNGMLLTEEFHALFDHGLVTVTPDHVVRVSPRIRDRWSNGRRFYEFDEKPLRVLPDSAAEQPSGDALRWHNRRLFVA